MNLSSAEIMAVLVSPSLEDARIALAKGLEERKMIVMVATCRVNYSGRTGSRLGEGERVIILKEDGCVLIHRGRDYQPVNWQPAGCVIQALIQQGHLLVKAVRPSPLESLSIEASHVQFLGTFHLKDEAEFILQASEEEMQKAILVQPDIIEPGLQIMDFEKKVEPGFVDVYAIDSAGNTVVIEIKKDPAGLPAIKQLNEYLKYIRASAGRKLRPMIVAPSLSKGVQPVLLKRGIEFKQLSLQKSMEILQKHSRTDQKALRGWIDQPPLERSGEQ